MMKDGRESLWRKAPIWMAGACFLLSMPCVLLGVLGLLGVVADVSVAENRQIGLAFLGWAVLPLGSSVVLLVVALLVRRSRPR